MKLRNKFLLAVGTVWGIFILLSYFGSLLFAKLQAAGVRITFFYDIEKKHFWLVNFIAFGLLVSLTLIILIRKILVERIEKLNNQVQQIGESNSLRTRIHLRGQDELSSVAGKINFLLDVIQNSQDELENRVELRTKELKEANIQLSKEINERQTVEKELTVHKEHLLQLSNYDALTNLPNRVFFNEILNKALSFAKNHNKKLAILFIDLDRFKNISDVIGSQTGDLVLKDIAHRFSKTIGTDNVLGRLGGDEFIVLLNNIENQHIVDEIAQKILEECRKPVKINVHDFFVTTSIAICIYPDDGSTLEELERNADATMYQAKQKGGNAFLYFSQEKNTDAHENTALTSNLKLALTNKEFVLNYQPQISLDTGNINAVEAFMRWDNPELGTVQPRVFIPIAEETGLIMEIGEWVIRQACFINKDWQSQGFKPMRITVNLSPIQFRHNEMVTIIKNILQESKLEPCYLELEIDESTIMDNKEDAIGRLNALKDLGLYLTISNFGMGYTSFNYLKRLSIDAVKIDHNFLKEIPQNQSNVAIIRGVIALAHSLDWKVIADGVESTEQMTFLSNNHCDFIQGYYISRPLSERKVILLFSKMATKQEPL